MLTGRTFMWLAAPSFPITMPMRGEVSKLVTDDEDIASRWNRIEMSNNSIAFHIC